MHIELTNPELLKGQAFIAGEWVKSSKNETFNVYNPSNGELICEVADCDQVDTDIAIASADKALIHWKTLTAKERSKTLRQWFDLILENQEDLAKLMTLEQGKPLTESRGEVVYAASFIEWFAEEAKRIYGDVIPSPAGDKRLITIKQPIGVVAAITPWNFPIVMITRKVAPALAAGCTVVVKPSEETPLCALALAQLAQQAGIPSGVLNIITTSQSKDVGKRLCDDQRVRKLSFTGSTNVGKLLMSQCGDTIKKVSLELGGNAPFIVFDDADIDAAVSGLIASKFRNAGQTCVCTNRVLVQDSIHDAFVEKLIQEVKKLSIGDGFEQGTTIGPLINAKASEKVTNLVTSAAEQGAKVAYQADNSKAHANFSSPAVLTNVTSDMEIAQTEIFGPVASIMRFFDEAQAIQIANDTPYGLAAYFYSRDIGRIWRVGEALEYGMVGINEGLISNEVAPFGGVKQSGLGREGSKYGMDDFVEIKYLCMGGI